MYTTPVRPPSDLRWVTIRLRCLQETPHGITSRCHLNFGSDSPPPDRKGLASSRPLVAGGGGSFFFGSKYFFGKISWRGKSAIVNLAARFCDNTCTSKAIAHIQTQNMSKRTAEREDGDTPLKGGDRPEPMDVDSNNNDDMGEFEDEFEDEFESEDEIYEAGVDGRPDAEREAEERGG